MESFCKATIKETSFSLYLEKWKTFYTIILAIKFYFSSKKEHLFCRISVTMKKKPGKKWCGKTLATSHELRVTSYELKA